MYCERLGGPRLRRGASGLYMDLSGQMVWNFQYLTDREQAVLTGELPWEGQYGPSD
jgi:hypothetical protein